MLNEMQKDVLLEQMNIYIGQAAALLSEMIDHRIDLSVPELNIMEVDIDNYICQAFPSLSDQMQYLHLFVLVMNFPGRPTWFSRR